MFQFMAGYGAVGGTSHDDMSKTILPVSVHQAISPGQGQPPQQGFQHAKHKTYPQTHQKQTPQVSLSCRFIVSCLSDFIVRFPI